MGTWKYVHERAIATRYDAFVGETPLCSLDQRFVDAQLPSPELRPQTILDLGCGTGRLAIPLAARGFRVMAIDLSLPMLQQMMDKARAFRGDNLSPGAAGSSQDPVNNLFAVQANLVELEGVAPDSADHAICMFSTLGMIQGHSHRLSMLRHAHRCVRPGGLLLLHVHRRWAALRESGGWARLGKNWFQSRVNSDVEFGDSTYAYRGLSEMFMHRFSKRELLSLLAESGWKLDRLEAVDLRGEKLTSSSWNASGYLLAATRIEAG